MRHYLPSNQDFVIRNLQFLASVKGRGQVLSFVMLLITSTGIFLPLEVALNSIWGFKKNRSYLMNWRGRSGSCIGVRDAGACCRLRSTAQGLNYFAGDMGKRYAGFRSGEFCRAESCGHRLQHRHLLPDLLAAAQRPRARARRAARRHHHGLLTEGAKHLYIRSLPWLNFQEVYGPFAVSVTLIFWSFWSGMLLLGGAYLSAAEHSERMQARRATAQDSK